MSWEESIGRGTLALARADYVSAEVAFRDALRFAEAESIGQDSRLNQTMSLLGQTYFKLGNSDKARRYLEKALALGDPNSLWLAVDHLTLSRISNSCGSSDDEKKHFCQAIQILQSTKLPSQASFETIQGLENMLTKSKKRELHKTNQQFRILLSQAKHKHQQKQESQQSYFGTEPELIVDAWQSLMESAAHLMTRNVADDLVKAFKDSNSAMRIALSLFPKDHSNVADSVTQLATVCMRLGLDAEADELFEEASRIADTIKADPLRRAALKVSRARFYARLDDYESALNLLGSAIEIIGKENCQGTEFGDTFENFLVLVQKAEIFNSARDLVKQGIESEENERFENAVFCYDNAISLLEKILGKKHLELAQILNFKASVLRKTNDSAEADEVQKRADDIEASITARLQNLEKLKAKLPAIRFSV